MGLSDQLQSALGPAYTIERELPGGGMARVFVAREGALGRSIVVKTIAPEIEGAVSAERFRREIRLVASLQQANIVPILSAGESGGLVYYTMPYIEGDTLRTLLSKPGPPAIREIVNILRDIARALSFAHERGVIHRDIKPENVLLSGSTAVVTDFGIAKALEAAGTEPGTSTLTQLGVAIGTPAYMAPEQASGEQHIDQRVDIYALGILAYELLTGAPPFTGRSAHATMAAHAMERPADVRTLRPDADGPLSGLVMSCLEKDPADRPQDARAVLNALDAIVGASLPVHAPRPEVMPMVAVLPFANLGPNADDEYFSDGMTEDIIAQLSQIGSVRVISRTSAMRFKKSELTIKEITATLGATHVVEGSVRRADKQLRIVAQLVEAATDTHLWAQTFDRDLIDVFAIQTQVAEQIAGALRVRLSSDEHRRVARRPTNDPQAYNLFLLARHHWNLATPDGFSRAEELCEQAIARDPTFGLAWASVAASRLWHVVGTYGIRPRDAAAQVLRYAKKALEIDPEIAEAHSVLGFLETYNFNWVASRLHHERALSLKPNSALAHLCYGEHLLTVGRVADAVLAAQHALELDPAADAVHSWANHILHFARRFDDALAGLDVAERQFGVMVTVVRGYNLIAVGREADAVECFRRAYEKAPTTMHLGFLAMGLAAAGFNRDAHAALQELHGRESREYVWPMPIAIAYARLGDMDKAFEYLERCYHDRAGWIPFPYTPWFDPFRADPRFDELVRRIGAVAPTPH